MSQDWILTSARALELGDVAEAAAAVDPAMLVRLDDTGRFLVMADVDGVPLVWIAPSRPVADPATARARHLPAEAAEASWWCEVVVPLPRGRRVDPWQGDVLRTLLGTLAGRAGGQAVEVSAGAWSPAEWTSPPAPDARDAPGDLLTASALVVLQTRAVVGLGPWLAAGLLWARDHGRRLVLVTPPGTRVTWPVERLLLQQSLRWVAVDGDQARDCRTGATLDLEREVLDGVPAGRDPAGVAVPPSIAEAPVDRRWGVVLDVDTVHDGRSGPVVGELLAETLAVLGRGPVATLGLLEPPEARWDPARLTALARDASPDPVSVVAAGDGVEAVITVRPQPVGVHERVELRLTAPEQPWSAPELVDLGSRLLAAGAQVVSLGYRPTTAGLLASSVPAGAVLPGLVALRPARFPTLGVAELPGPARGVVRTPHGWVVPLEVPPGAPEQERAAVLADWLRLHLLIQRHDALAVAVRNQRGERASPHGS